MMAKRSGPTDQHVGNRIRMRRVMLHMSQSDLGKKVGVSFQQIQKYEKGTNRVGASRLQHIAQTLGVSVPFFFEELLPESPDALEINQFMATRDGFSLAKAFMAIKSKKMRRAIVDVVVNLEQSRRRH